MARLPNFTISPKNRAAFLARVLDTMGETPASFARKSGIPRRDVDTLLRTARNRHEPIQASVTWLEVARYVNAQVAAMLAVREELNRQIADDAKRMAIEHLRVRNRP